MTYRDKKLLELAEGMPCLLKVDPNCLGEGDTTVSAHSNLGIHGKGKSIKAEDCYSVWACYHCHTWLDQGKAPKKEKETAWMIGFERQIDQWQEIADNPLIRPWKREAAQRVIKHLESLNG